MNEGSGPVTTTIPAGWYTAAGLATAIESALNSNAFLARTYTFTYNAISRRFQIAVTTGSVTLLTNSAPSRNILTILLGWDNSADTSAAVGHQADHARSSTVSWVQYFAPHGGGIAPNLWGMFLSSTGGTDTDLATLYGNVTVYGAAGAPLGSSEAAWAAAATASGVTLNVSDRPTEAGNTLQVAVTSNASAFEYWAVFWKHVDDHEYHRMGLLRACKAVSSATRTVREVQTHDIVNPKEPLTLRNQHPVQLKTEWAITVELERWEVSEFRAWMNAAKRYAGDGVFFSLRWTDIVSGSLDARDECDIGFLFYGSIRSSTPYAYSAGSSDFISGAISFGQVRV